MDNKKEDEFPGVYELLFALEKLNDAIKESWDTYGVRAELFPDGTFAVGGSVNPSILYELDLEASESLGDLITRMLAATDKLRAGFLPKAVRSVMAIDISKLEDAQLPAIVSRDKANEMIVDNNKKLRKLLDRLEAHDYYMKRRLAEDDRE